MADEGDAGECGMLPADEGLIEKIREYIQKN